jgi:hypothetical protein
VFARQTWVSSPTVRDPRGSGQSDLTTVTELSSTRPPSRYSSPGGVSNWRIPYPRIRLGRIGSLSFTRSRSLISPVPSRPLCRVCIATRSGCGNWSTKKSQLQTPPNHLWVSARLDARPRMYQTADTSRDAGAFLRPGLLVYLAKESTFRSPCRQGEMREPRLRSRNRCLRRQSHGRNPGRRTTCRHHGGLSGCRRRRRLARRYW